MQLIPASGLVHQAVCETEGWKVCQHAMQGQSLHNRQIFPGFAEQLAAPFAALSICIGGMAHYAFADVVQGCGFLLDRVKTINDDRTQGHRSSTASRNARRIVMVATLSRR
jgi:hypothetical protein